MARLTFDEFQRRSKEITQEQQKSGTWYNDALTAIATTPVRTSKVSSFDDFLAQSNAISARNQAMDLLLDFGKDEDEDEKEPKNTKNSRVNLEPLATDQSAAGPMAGGIEEPRNARVNFQRLSSTYDQLVPDNDLAQPVRGIHYYNQIDTRPDAQKAPQELQQQDLWKQAANQIGGELRTAYSGVLSPAQRATEGERQRRLQGYAMIPSLPDYAENSRYRDNRDGEVRYNALSGMFTGGYADPEYAAINRQTEARGMREANAATTGAGFVGESQSELDMMTDQEIGIYNYLYATRGKEEADQYIEDIRRDLTARQNEERNTRYAEWAQEQPVAASAFSVVEGPYKALSFVGQLADYAEGESTPYGYGGNVDTNAGYNKFAQTSGAVRGAVGQQIQDKVSARYGDAAGVVANKGYQLFMSYLDSRYNALISGAVPFRGEMLVNPEMAEGLSLGIMGAGAAADSMIEAKKRGLDDGQAFMLGLIGGAAEIVTEQYSLESLLDADLAKESAVRYLVKTMAAEGSEEMASDLINEVADLWVSGDQAEMRQEIAGYMAEGMTRGQATGKAIGRFALQVLESGLGGALMGGLGGGMMIGTNALGTRSTGREIRNMGTETVQSVIDTGLQSPEGTYSRELAERAQKKQAAGKKLSATEIGRLQQVNELQIEEEVRTEDESLDQRAQDTLLELARDKVAEETGVDMTQAVEETPAESRQNEARAAETAQEETTRAEEETGRSEARSEAAEAENETEFVELGGEEETTRIPMQSRSLMTMRTRLAEAYETQKKQAFDPAQLEKVKSAFGTAGQKALTDNYKGEQMTAPYVRGFMAFYNAGLTGTRASDVSLGARTLISTDAAVRAWAAGRQDAQAKNAQLTAQKGSVAVVQNPGVDYSDAKTSEWAAKNGETARRVNQLTQALGMSMTVEDIIRVGKTGEANAQLLNARLTLSNNAEKRTATYRGENISNPVMWTIGHEVGHRLRELAPEAFDALAKTMPQEAVRDIEWQQYAYAKAGVDEKFESAAEEAAANYVADLLEGGQVLDEFIDRQTSAGNRSLLQKLGDMIRRVYRDVKAYLSGDEARAIRQSIKKLEAALDAAAEQARENAKNGKFAENETQKAASAADIQKSNYSIKSSFEAIGMDARLEGGRVVVYDQNGNRVEHVTEQHVRGSVLGAMIDYALNETGTITEAEAKKQIKGMTDLLNIMIKAQDGDLVWKFSGAAMFSAVKSNSDGQYGTTVDFSTVCRKTQEMMDAMSEAMIRLGRGLTKAEVIELQADILSEGGTVPCPVCYVFSRWAGVGGILDNMAKWQERYKGIEWDDPAKVQARINEIKAATRTKADLRRTLMEQDQRYIDLAAQKEDADRKRTELRNKSKRATLTEEERTQIDKEIRALKAMSDGLNKQMKEIENSGAPEAAWLERVRIKPDYREHGDVPLNVLYNLSDAEKMAGNYPLAWGYRTTRGPSAGKAILPYADMRVGDMVMGPGKNRVKGNAFETLSATLTDDQRSEIEKALMRVKAQNLIGGQRYQSTSDFRYDYGLDYLLSFFEGQMLGTKMQTYTKIIEFVDMVNAVRGDVNISMMPYEAGYVEENGVDKLVYSSVTGVNEEAAIRANSLYDNAQLILVGINDRHIRAALEDSEETGGIHIGFVIPYHASGASINEFIRGLVENLSESFNEEYYRDYSKIQTDSVSRRSGAAEKRLREIRDSLLRGKHKVTTTDPVTGKTTTGQRDWRPTEQDLALIRGKSKDISGMSFDALRDIERRALAGDKAAIREYKSWSAGVLWDIYNKMWVDESAEETYGVRLNTAQAASIMPHEYWDKSVSRDKAYINGFIFRSYCYNLGLTPRFTGVDSSGRNIGYGDFSDSRGYWKTLIDRPMYDNSGRYRDQQRINVTRLSDTISESDAGMLSPEYGETAWEGFKVREPEKAVSERAANKFVARKRAEGAKLSLKQRDDAYAAAVERGDMDEAQRMVDEAAKAAGYDTPRLYHGTRAFGFTEFDASKSNDGISFFATDSPMTARTYSGETDRNRIKDAARINVDNLRGEALLEEAKKQPRLQRYKDYRLMRGEERQRLIEEERRGIALTAQDAADFINDHEGAFDADKMAVMDRLLNALSDVSTARDEDSLQEAWDRWSDAMWDLKWMDEDIQMEFIDAIGNRQLQLMKKHLDDFMYNGDIFFEDDEYGFSYVFDSQVALELDAELHKGVYELYGKTGNQLVIDADGSNWNQIAAPDELNLYGPQRTRDIAVAAKANGYDSVLFKNLRDNGGETAYNGESNVYIFFNASDLKSADPVTYDDDGNMIPLSERFNSEKQDIRYSLKGTETESLQFKRWFGDWTKNPQGASKIVNEDGTPKIVYHQTAGDFTVFSNENPVAGATDSETPNGYFFKDNDHDIGLGGGRQMAVYLNMRKPLHFKNREEANRWYQRHVDGYADLQNEMQRKLDPIDAEMNWLESEMFGDDVTDEKYDELNARWDELHDEMKAVEDDYRGRLRELLNQHFLENDSGYDGIILDYDGHRYVNGKRENVKSYIVFKNTQIKSATDNVGTFDESNPDINYSLKGTETQREIAELREQVDRLRTNVERWKNETKRSDRQAVDPKVVERTARALAKEYTGSAKGADITKDLESLYNFISHGGDGKDDLTFESAFDRALAIADTLVENAVTQDDEAYREYEALRRYCRETPFVLGPEDAANITDYSSWAKGNRGRLRVKRGDRTNVDSYYQEMAQEWPEFFDPDITDPADQIMRIRSVLDGLYTINEYNPFSENMEDAKLYAANDIMARFWDVPNVKKTFADRAEERLIRETSKWRERAEQNVQTERQKREEAMQRLKDHYKEVKARASERKADSQARTRLLKIAKRLQNKKLPAAGRALLDQYIGDLDTVSKSITGKTLDNLRELEDWYRAKTNPDSAEYDPDFIPDNATLKKLERLHQRRIADMTADEVADLTDILLNIENELRTSKQLIDQEDRRNVYHMGEEVIKDIYSTKGNDPGVRGAAGRFIATQTLSPVRLMHKLTGYNDADPMYKLTQALNDGQRAAIDYERRAKIPFRELAADKSFNKMFSGKDADTIQVTGLTKDGARTVTITPAMRVSLYLHSLNNQNLRHIRDGGITVPDAKLYAKGNIQEAYNRGVTIKLEPSQVRAITSRMTPKEREFARLVHNYFNGMSRTEINEVSEKLKGYSLAQVEDYYPIKTDRSFGKGEFESMKFDGTIEGMGWTKERQAGAANPIMLMDVNRVLDQSISQHAKYVGLAIPVRNFNKVWGVTTASYDAQGNRSSYESSVQQALKQRWGGTNYDAVEKMMTDLQNPRSGADNPWSKVLSKLQSNYAGAVLALNLSVAIKQTASYPTAAAVLGWEPLAKAMKNFGRVNLDLIEKYTPLQWYRSQGFSTRELGDMAKNPNAMNRLLSKPALNWVQGMDVLTTRKLWKASEYYVQANNKDVRRGTDEYYKAVADIYNRVIEETQPNYTTMQRPNMLRSDNDLLRAISMFKTQPFQNFNVIYDAAGNLRAKLRQGDEAAIKQAKKEFGWAVTSQAAQLAVFAGMTMLWQLFRGKKDKYDDDDGEVSLTSMLTGLSKDMIAGAASIVPFGGEVWELIASKVFGEKYYGLDVSAIETVNDAVAGLQSADKLISDMAQKIVDGEPVDAAGTWIKLKKVLGNVSKIAGAPVDNVLKLSSAIYRRGAIAAYGRYLGEYKALTVTSDPNTSTNRGAYYDLLYKASQNDQKQYVEMYKEMLESGAFTADQIKSGMEDRMKQAEGVNSVKDLSHRFVAPK